MQLVAEFSLVDKDDSWMADAACKEATDADFHPESIYSAGAKRAIAVCKTCLVRRECLQFAVTNGIGEGIWGGMLAHQRRKYALGVLKEDTLGL